MKKLSVIIILLFCVNLHAREKVESNKNAYLEVLKNGNISDDGCGSSLADSQMYGYRQGKIIKIITSNKVLFQQNSLFGHKDKERFTIVLVGIDSKKNKDRIKNFLKENVLNQSVSVVGNTKKDSNKKFGGVITLFNEEKEDINNISEYLLEKGIAKYKDFNLVNLVPYYMPCRLEKAEQRAKAAKLGIWAK